MAKICFSYLHFCLWPFSYLHDRNPATFITQSSIACCPGDSCPSVDIQELIFISLWECSHWVSDISGFRKDVEKQVSSYWNETFLFKPKNETLETLIQSASNSNCIFLTNCQDTFDLCKSLFQELNEKCILVNIIEIVLRFFSCFQPLVPSRKRFSDSLSFPPTDIMGFQPLKMLWAVFINLFKITWQES